MSPVQIRNLIVSNFAHLELKAWEFLEVKGGKLEKSDCQQLGGEVCQRRGAVYLNVIMKSTWQGTTLAYNVLVMLKFVFLHVNLSKNISLAVYTTNVHTGLNSHATRNLLTLTLVR